VTTDCAECGEPIEPGDETRPDYRWHGGALVHYECSDEALADNPADHHGWPSSALTEDTDIPEAK
jgi:hypothetical protein